MSRDATIFHVTTAPLQKVQFDQRAPDCTKRAPLQGADMSTIFACSCRTATVSCGMRPLLCSCHHFFSAFFFFLCCSLRALDRRSIVLTAAWIRSRLCRLETTLREGSARVACRTSGRERRRRAELTLPRQARFILASAESSTRD